MSGLIYDTGLQTITAADGTKLRLLHLNTELDPGYVAAVDATGYPVTMGAGLWNNLFYFQPLGREIINEYARDVWLIEMTGGDIAGGTDCPNCKNYRMSDLTTDYFPNLVDEVLTQTGKNKTDLVVYSNGCGTAIRSLDNGATDDNKVDTLVGIGCPNNFETLPLLAEMLNDHGTEAINALNQDMITHVSFSELARRLREESFPFSPIDWGLLALLGNFYGGGEETFISVNLLDDYRQVIQDQTDTPIGSQITVNRIGLIDGLYDPIGRGPTEGDLIISSRDVENSFTNINTRDTDKSFHLRRDLFHHELVPSPISKRQIKQMLNQNLEYQEGLINQK